DLQTQLAHEGLHPDMAGRIRNYMEIMRFEEGQVVFREGDPADEIYLIELGQVSVYLNADSPDRIRLRSLQTGTMIGEVGIFTRGKRSATVIADETTIVYRLTREGIDRMEEEEPLLAAEFNALVLRLVADRLARASRLIERVRA
ncbi:MAG: cyclic nucleotide-binding domain-containing protein, partial [Anaerolineae bacterium]